MVLNKINGSASAEISEVWTLGAALSVLSSALPAGGTALAKGVLFWRQVLVSRTGSFENSKSRRTR